MGNEEKISDHCHIQVKYDTITALCGSALLKPKVARTVLEIQFQTVRTTVHPPEMCNLGDRIKAFFNILN